MKTSCVPDTFLNCRTAVVNNKVFPSWVLHFSVKRQTVNKQRKYHIVVSTGQRIKLG